MIVCPHCAEDLADATEICTACETRLPDWVHRLPLSAPRDDRVHAVLGALLFRACQVALVVIAFVLIAFLVVVGPRR